MRHSRYLALEKLTNSLADKYGLIEKDPKNYKGDKNELIEKIIQYGEKKGQKECFNARNARQYDEQLKKCFTILPRDNMYKLSGGIIDKTGVTVDSLVSDNPCSKEERTRQQLIVYRFIMMCQMAGGIRILY